LSEVYEENDLERFLEFPDFKAGLTIYQTNDDLKFLEFEYSEKLGQKNLSLEERDRLEAEFLEKKKTALVPIYTMSFRPNQRKATISEALIAKMLNDTLRTWANHADRVKGINKYQYSLVSRNILSEKSLLEEDYFIATDMLRTTIERVSDDIRKLKQIPGAWAAKVGENSVSLQDLQFRMQDIERFKLSPLVGLIRQAGVSKERTYTMGYLRNRLFDLSLKEEAANANLSVYKNTLNQYIHRTQGALTTPDGTLSTTAVKQGVSTNVPVMIPQFSASFLDSLIQMAQENSAMLFRQEISEKVISAGLDKVKIDMDRKYYQELYNRITADHVKDNEFAIYQESTLERIRRSHKEVYNALMQTIDEANAIYLGLSKYNLNPESVLYTLTKPIAVESRKLISRRKAINYFIATSIFSISAIILGILVFGSIAVLGREKKGLGPIALFHQRKPDAIHKLSMRASMITRAT